MPDVWKKFCAVGFFGTLAAPETSCRLSPSGFDIAVTDVRRAPMVCLSDQCTGCGGEVREYINVTKATDTSLDACLRPSTPVYFPNIGPGPSFVRLPISGLQPCSPIQGYTGLPYCDHCEDGFDPDILSGCQLQRQIPYCCVWARWNPDFERWESELRLKDLPFLDGCVSCLDSEPCDPEAANRSRLLVPNQYLGGKCKKTLYPQSKFYQTTVQAVYSAPGFAVLEPLGAHTGSAGSELAWYDGGDLNVGDTVYVASDPFCTNLILSRFCSTFVPPEPAGPVLFQTDLFWQAQINGDQRVTVVVRLGGGDGTEEANNLVYTIPLPPSCFTIDNVSGVDPSDFSQTTGEVTLDDMSAGGQVSSIRILYDNPSSCGRYLWPCVTSVASDENYPMDPDHGCEMICLGDRDAEADVEVELLTPQNVCVGSVVRYKVTLTVPDDACGTVGTSGVLNLGMKPLPGSLPTELDATFRNREEYLENGGRTSSTGYYLPHYNSKICIWYEGVVQEGEEGSTINFLTAPTVFVDDPNA